MNKLHTIVSNHEITSQKPSHHMTNAQNTYHQRQLDEMTRLVEEKDH